MINIILEKLLNGTDLTMKESTETADFIMNGKVNNSQIAAMLTANSTENKGRNPRRDCRICNGNEKKRN